MGQLAGGGQARPLIEASARLGAGFDEVPGSPAIAAGGLAVDRAAAGPVEHEIARVGSAGRVDDEAVLVAFDPGEVARVVFEDAHSALPLHFRKALSALGSMEHLA